MNRFVKCSTFRVLKRALSSSGSSNNGSQNSSSSWRGTLSRTIQLKKILPEAADSLVLNDSEQLMMKKRIPRQRPRVVSGIEGLSEKPVVGQSTADEYDLNKLRLGFIQDDIYLPVYYEHFDDIDINEEVIHFTSKFLDHDEEFFVFKEGTVVFWNMSPTECRVVLKSLKQYEINPYDPAIVIDEHDVIDVVYTETTNSRFENSLIYLNTSNDPAVVNLEKYAFSHAIAVSAKLSIFEAKLSRYVDTIIHITKDIQEGRKTQLTRQQVYRKTGRFYGLLHRLELNDGLTSMPDFYWHRRELEKLFEETRSFMKVGRRTSVLKEKLQHCVELMDLLQNHLDDVHHVRLEMMVIYLILVEVLFEIVNMAERLATATNFSFNDPIANLFTLL